MNRRMMLPISFILLALLVLVLAGCERDRPVETTGTAVPARGTVAPSPTPGSETGAEATAATAAPEAGAAATPTAPAPQPAAGQSSGAASTAGSAATGQESTYTVVAGDTLASIAQKYGVTQAAIVQLNNLADPNKLVLGQQLKIPAGGTAASAGTGSSAAGSSGTSAAASGGTASAAASSYVVQRGDTLGQIAQRYNTTVAELMRLNSLTNPDRIAVGQKLTVPGSSGQTQPAATTGSGQTRTYVVQKGDTLLSIARRFGLTVKQMQDANDISNPDRIYPGQTLKIP